MKDWTYNPTYKKGRTLTTTLVMSGLVLAGWTALLIVMNDRLPVIS